MRVTEEDLIRWGRKIGESVDPPVFLAIRGVLGAGKSVLARAIAHGAGVEESLPSPTFNLLFRYQGRGDTVVTHLDLYRLTDPEEVWELGWTEVGAEKEIVLVEWPERAGAYLPSDRWEVEIRIPEDETDLRDVSVSRVGAPPFLPGFPITVAERMLRV